MIARTCMVARGMILVMAASCGAAAAATDFVWWEGESAAKTNFSARSWFSESTFQARAHLLSGGKWLSNSGKRTGDEAFATYRLNVPAAAEYHFWTRKFWKHGPFRWRFDREVWQTCGRDIALADSVTLKQHTCANWVYLGKVKLPKGEHVFELRLLAAKGESLTAAFDCFVLSRKTFTPNGKLKPGERSGQADEGFFAYEPATDNFAPDALLDLRHLNEGSAGRDGFVTSKGGSFVLGSGKPVRFWGVNVSANNAAQDRASVDYLARRLAKSGVNIVRYHSRMFLPGGDPAKVDPKALDNLHYLVAAMKKQGIYTKISFYFPLWFDIKPGYGIPGYDTIQNKKPFALLFFDPRMQQIYRSWAKGILTTKNPYTGTSLAKEPAVAIVEIVNEDNYFFWTFNKKSIPAVHWQRLEELYSKSLARRNVARKGKLVDAWNMTRGGLKQASGETRKHISDQIRFLTEHQRAFFADMARYFHKDLGYGGLVSAGNWKTADAALLDGLERYTYTAGDVIDHHGYFSGTHKGEGANYSVRVGHTFSNLAAVTAPQRLPFQVNRVKGYPHIISEIGWPNPNRYRADATFLTSAYASLQGIDGLFWFAIGSNSLCDKTMNKFAASCPTVVGTFPAAALQYRRGDVRQAPTVYHEALKIEDLYALKGSGASAQAYDKLRQADIPKGAATGAPAAGPDPLSFYVGAVTRSFDDAKAKPVRQDLRKYINAKEKTVTSITGQLRLDYGRGIATVNTPRSQGVAGLVAKAGPIKLADVTITTSNEFASIMVISLDDRPLADSQKILVQAITVERPYGFKAAGGRITNLGSAPIGVERIAARIAVRSKGAKRLNVVALDENGYRTNKPVRVIPRDWPAATTVELTPDAVYHVITR